MRTSGGLFDVDREVLDHRVRQQRAGRALDLGDRFRGHIPGQVDLEPLALPDGGD